MSETITNKVNEVTVNYLIAKFKKHQVSNSESLTFNEAQFLCENEDHEAFMFDSSLYTDIMDMRDHLEEEGEY